jgi:hypothetical protein
MGKKEVIILTFVVFANLVFCTVYHKLVHHLSLTWFYLIIVGYCMKACLNEDAYNHDRSLVRNFVFNAIRMLNAEILSVAFFGDWSWYEPNDILLKLVMIAAATLFARLVKRANGFENHSLFWSICICTWVTNFALYSLGNLQKVERVFDGRILPTQGFMLFDAGFYLYGDFIEDLIMGDLNLIKTMASKWGWCLTFVPTITL